uniref:DUF177 domain-containing protein n=1 Tax=Caldisericum exile TaxID=693075 RepID=A0A7C4Y3V4_9BACT
MKLLIDRIIEESPLTIEESFDIRDAPFKLATPAKAKLTFEDIGNREVLVKGVIIARLRLTCVVCLDEFEEELKIDVSETYVPKEYIEKGEERPLEELSEFEYTGNYLDTYEIVKDNICEFLPPYPKCPKCASQNSKS